MTEPSASTDDQFARDVAFLWRRILKTDPLEIFESARGAQLDRAHGFDRLPQPGFVGSNYRVGGMLLIGQNPASDAAANGLSEVDRRQYAALINLREVHGASEVRLASESLMATLGDVMPTWKLFRVVIAPLLRRTGQTLHEVAYINLVKFRTASPKLEAPIYHASWPAALDQIELLRPSLIVTLGNGTRAQLQKRYRGSVPTMKIQRNNGDTMLPVAGYSDIEKIGDIWRGISGQQRD